MLLRIHRSQDNKEVVGICDRELIGKTFREGEISLCVSDAFFGTNAVNEEEIVRVLLTSDNITLFGTRCVDLAICQGVVDKESCRIIEGIPYATVLRL